MLPPCRMLAVGPADNTESRWVTATKEKERVASRNWVRGRMLVPCKSVASISWEARETQRHADMLDSLDFSSVVPWLWYPLERDTNHSANGVMEKLLQEAHAWHPFLSSIISISSVAQSCPTLCDPMNRSTLGLPVHHQLAESTQTHVHRVGDAIQPSHPLSSPSPPALNLSQHQGLFKWASSLHQVAKVLEFQLQHQSFQWTPRTDLL